MGGEVINVKLIKFINSLFVHFIIIVRVLCPTQQVDLVKCPASVLNHDQHQQSSTWPKLPETRGKGFNTIFALFLLCLIVSSIFYHMTLLITTMSHFSLLLFSWGISDGLFSKLNSVKHFEGTYCKMKLEKGNTFVGINMLRVSHCPVPSIGPRYQMPPHCDTACPVIRSHRQLSRDCPPVRTWVRQCDKLYARNPAFYQVLML